MRKCYFVAGWLAVSFLYSSHAFASSAWWMLCDWCNLDSDFEHQALNAPGSYSPIYVTNRETNETRKYDRITIIDDLWDGVSETVVVSEANFPASEEAVFQQAIDNANVLDVEISRNDLSAYLSNFSNQGSVVGDIDLGYIDNRLLNALRLAIEDRNLLPDHTSVSEDAGLSTPIVGANYGSGSTIRVKDLVITIVYEDGSTITVARKGGDGEFTNWSVIDAEGNEVPLEDPENGTSVNPAAFAGREFYFGGPGSAAGSQGLADFVVQTTELVCSTTSRITDNLLSIWTVRCQRP